MSALATSNTDAATNLLRAAAAKIDESLLRENPLTKNAKSRIIRGIDGHGEDGVVSMKMMPSWSENSSPVNFVTGFRMIFDASRATVVPSVINANSLYAGTMAYRVPASLLQGSQLSEDGPLVHRSQIAKVLNANVAVSGAGISDSYAGLFEHTSRGPNEYTHEYWAIARGVEPQLNTQLSEQIDAHDGKSYSSMMKSTALLRVETFEKQQFARAEKISAVLRSVGIEASASDIMNGQYVENVFNTIVDGPTKNQASLHSDAVTVDSHTLANGLLVTENMHLGPILLRGNASSAAGQLSVLPSSTGFTMPLYAAMRSAGALSYDKKSKISANNPCTWESASESEMHPLLATNAYRTRTAVWKGLEERAGFIAANTIALNPIAVKLAHPTDL